LHPCDVIGNGDRQVDVSQGFTGCARAEGTLIAVSSFYLLIVAVLLFSSLSAWAFVPTAFTVWGGVIAWAYLSASARLGIVEASVGEGSAGPLSIVRKLAAAWSGMRGKLKRGGWDDAFLAQLLAVFCRTEVR
jgi:hypothetical protein